MTSKLAYILIGIIITTLILLKKNKFTIDPFLLVSMTLFQNIIGLWILTNNFIVVLKFSFGVLMFILGYLSIKNINKKNLLIKKTSNLKFIIFEFIIFFLIIYHFSFGIIPLFNENVEIDRFNFTSSGLFGIPGRIYLYGLPYIYICAYLKYENTNNKKNYYFITIFYTISRMLGGVKSGLIEILLLYITLRYISYKPIKLKKIFSYRNILSIGIMTLFIFKLTQSYKTMEHISYSEFLKYILERMTVIQSLSIKSIFEIIRTNTIIDTNIYTDMIHLIGKYTKLYKSSIIYTTDNIISAYTYKTPLDGKSFIVPVTISAIGELFLNYKNFMYFFIFLIGVFYGYLLKRLTRKNRNIYEIGKYIFVVFMLENFITKGGLAYGILNCLLMIFIFYLLEKLSEIILNILKIKKGRK